MKSSAPLPYRASLEAYQQQAELLLAELKAGDEPAAWRFKWLHPRFRGKPVTDVQSATLDASDSQAVVCREYGFDNWDALAKFTEAVRHAGPVERFEAAVEAVIAGDLAMLQTMLRDNPELATARSSRHHRATLLHYVGANGVEQGRQRTPANAVEIAKALLNAGAEVDALADMYDEKCTTMSMLVSSSHPAKAGLQAALAETLLDYGAAIDGPGSKWQSAIMTALIFGYLDTAHALARHTSPPDDLATVAGLGRLDDVTRLLPTADALSKHVALSLAAQHGHADVVRSLLAAGEDPNRYNPEGFHSHTTPLHQAALFGHANVVRVFVEHGARLDLRDTIYQGTPLGWAIHNGQTAIADYLRAHAAPQ